MAATIRNAVPQAIKRGIQDRSGRPPVIEPEMIPSHLPHVFIYAERGPLEPQLVVGGSLTRMYGAKSLSYRGPYATHQTVLLNTVNARGNSCMVQRVVPDDAGPPAVLALGLDIVEEELPEYERNDDGTYRLDAEGNPVETGDTVTGHIAKWAVREVADGEIGTGVVQTGELLNQKGDQSTFYPMFDLSVSHVGKYGDNIGVRFSAPTTRSSIPLDEETVLDQKAYLYRAQFVERPTEDSSPNVVPSNFGEQYVDFSFKEGVINTRIDKEYYYEDVVIPSYQELEESGQPPKYGPFSQFHVYHENLEAVLEMVYENEVLFGELPVDDEDEPEGFMHIINLFSAVDVNGVPYHTFRVLGPTEGGLQLSENATHYASGGSDGTLSLENFDALVGNVCATYDTQPWPLLDEAQYPQSVIYDTGFTIETKEKLLVPMSLRKDIYVVLSTQDVMQPQLSISEESSMAISLRAMARTYPESEIYGTSTCRAIIFGHSGYLINSQYKGLLPLTIEFADKCAQYMGAGTGIWNAGMGFDVPGQNHYKMFKGVNNTFKLANVRNRDWDNGLVFVQRYDRRSLFAPAVQTVYDDDTSVLNSAITMIACVELEKIADRVWRDLTGISYLTNEQFIERSDALIERAAQGRFDNRFVIEPVTTITGNDEKRGFSWTTEITIYSANQKTVGTFTITARRLDDYEGA